MNAPMASRTTPRRDNGRMVGSELREDGLLFPIPDGQQVQAGGKDDQARDDRTRSTVVLKTKGGTVRPAHPTNDGEHTDGDARDTEQGEKDEERAHDDLW